MCSIPVTSSTKGRNPVSKTLLRSALTLAFAAATVAALSVPASASAGPSLNASTDADVIESTLRGALGDAYGYHWLDGDTIVVGVTSASGASAARAVGAEPRLVAHSAAKLDAIKASYDRQWAKAPAGIAGWGVDATTNSVVIYVVGHDAAALSVANGVRAGSSAVRVEAGAQAPQPYWNIIGGQAIYTGGSRCSVGFNARNSAGTRFVITAGHCTNIGSTWSGVGGALGSRYASSFPTNDYGLIRVTSSSAVSTPYVDRYSSGSDVRVAGASSAYVGMRVCRSGSTTGWICGSTYGATNGQVTATNQTVCYSQGCVYQTIRTNLCAQPGDSGGSMVTNPGTGTSVRAVGITSGGSGNCSSGGTTFFQTVTEPLSVYGLTLYT